MLDSQERWSAFIEFCNVVKCLTDAGLCSAVISSEKQYTDSGTGWSDWLDFIHTHARWQLLQVICASFVLFLVIRFISFQRHPLTLCVYGSRHGLETRNGWTANQKTPSFWCDQSSFPLTADRLVDALIVQQYYILQFMNNDKLPLPTDYIAINAFTTQCC